MTYYLYIKTYSDRIDSDRIDVMLPIGENYLEWYIFYLHAKVVERKQSDFKDNFIWDLELPFPPNFKRKDRYEYKDLLPLVPPELWL